MESLKYIERGKIRQATETYYDETRVHKQKVKQLNKARNETLTEYENIIREYLEQHNQQFIEEISVIDEMVFIELERDIGITPESMLVLEEISDEWSVVPQSNHLEVRLKLWDEEESHKEDKKCLED